MSQRIRYSKQTDGTFRSVRAFSAREGDVVIVYNSETFEAKILNAATDAVLLATSSKSNHEMKKAIKKSLNELGVVFVVESRSKRVYTDEAS